MAKAVFFDIDNTIWDLISCRIPESTVEAIRRLRARGHYAFLNSGRTRGHIRESSLYEIGFDGMVSGLGTLVECVPKAGDAPGRTIGLSLQEEDLLYDYQMPAAFVAGTLEKAARHGFRPMLEGREYVYFEDRDFRDDEYAKLVKSRLGDRVQSIDGHWGHWEISKLACDMVGAEIEEGLADLAEDFDIFLHGQNVCELVPKGHGKDSGMIRICRHLGIPKEDSFAFGDGGNDQEFLAAAGTGIAMGNAIASLKERADFVTADLHEDGIFKALRHFQLI